MLESHGHSHKTQTHTHGQGPEVDKIDLNKTYYPS